MIDNEKTGLRIYFFPPPPFLFPCSLGTFVRTFTDRLPIRLAPASLYICTSDYGVSWFFVYLLPSVFPIATSNLKSRRTKQNLIIAFFRLLLRFFLSNEQYDDREKSKEEERSEDRPVTKIRLKFKCKGLENSRRRFYRSLGSERSRCWKEAEDLESGKIRRTCPHSSPFLLPSSHDSIVLLKSTCRPW